MYSTEFITSPFLPLCLAYHCAALEYFEMLKYINSIWKRYYEHVRFPLTSLIIDCTLLLSECIIINLRALFPLGEARCCVLLKSNLRRLGFVNMQTVSLILIKQLSLK